jgi:hypothetical protein
MCDYSLLGIPNRLATEDERLVVHRFQTGAMGLASSAEIATTTTDPHVSTIIEGWWSALKNCFTPSPAKLVCAVCIPPGARLLLRDIPERLQRQYQVGAAEGVTFTQISAVEYHYRDAVRFANGREIVLQKLEEDQRVEVLCLREREELPQLRSAHIPGARIRG